MNFRKNYADRKTNMSFSVAEWTDIVLTLAIVSSDTNVKEERRKGFLNLAKKVNANLKDFGDTIIGKLED